MADVSVVVTPETTCVVVMLEGVLLFGHAEEAFAAVFGGLTVVAIPAGLFILRLATAHGN